MRHISAFAIVLATLSSAAASHAEDPKRVEWSEDWPRFRIVEGVNVVALTIGSYVLSAVPPQQQASVAASSGGFDDWTRKTFRGHTASVQSTAATLSDYLYQGGVLIPYVIDVYVVALGVHQSVDVAAQMFLMNLQSLGFAGVLSLSAERAVGRPRPYVQDCGPDGKVRDAQGNVLFNSCSPTGGDFESFYSGHAAATATMAGLTCAHHQHIPLYGGGFADLAPCLFMIGVSATTGVARLVADRHWGTDVLLGWGVGAVSGYVLPSLLHYGFTKGRPLGEVHIAGMHMVPVPQTYPSGGGLGMAGYF